MDFSNNEGAPESLEKSLVIQWIVVVYLQTSWEGQQQQQKRLNPNLKINSVSINDLYIWLQI